MGSWKERYWGRLESKGACFQLWRRLSPSTDPPAQFPELFVASYNKNPMAVNEPDGIACVWNLHLLERPEFVFHSQVRPAPFHRKVSH